MTEKNSVHGIPDEQRSAQTMATHLYQAAQNQTERVLVHAASTVASATEASTVPTTAPAADVVQDDSLRFILVPLAVLLAILALSALVYLMARNRRRLAHIYCKRRRNRNIPKYTLDDDSDTAMEQGDGLDIDDPSECLLTGKLQIDNNYESYNSTARKDLYA